MFIECRFFSLDDQRSVAVSHSGAFLYRENAEGNFTTDEERVKTNLRDIPETRMAVNLPIRCRPVMSKTGMGQVLPLSMSLLLSFFFVHSIVSQEISEPASRVRTLTVDEAVQLALSNNRTLISARHRRDVQRLSLSVSSDRYRPRASIGASYHEIEDESLVGQLSVDPSLRIPTGGSFNLRWTQDRHNATIEDKTRSVTFHQPLLKGFGVGVDTAPVRLARITEQQNILLLRDTLASVILSTVSAYNGLVRADQAVAISRESLARATRQLDVNKSLIQVGRMADREIVQTEAEVANRTLALAESENALSRANAALLSILDIDDASLIHPSRELPVVEAHAHKLQTSLAIAFEKRNDYLRSKLDEEAAQISLTVAKNARLWDLNLNASIETGSDGERDYGAGLGLAIPLGDRGRQLAFQRARADLRDVKLDIAELRQSITIAVRQAISDVDTGFQRVKLAERARELAEETVAVEQDKLSRGLTSTFRLSAVEDDLVQSRTKELDAVIAYLNAVSRLDWTLGITLDTYGVNIDNFQTGPASSIGER